MFNMNICFHMIWPFGLCAFHIWYENEICFDTQNATILKLIQHGRFLIIQLWYNNYCRFDVQFKFFTYFVKPHHVLQLCLIQQNAHASVRYNVSKKWLGFFTLSPFFITLSLLQYVIFTFDFVSSIIKTCVSLSYSRILFFAPDPCIWKQNRYLISRLKIWQI